MNRSSALKIVSLKGKIREAAVFASELSYSFAKSCDYDEFQYLSGLLDELVDIKFRSKFEEAKEKIKAKK